MRVEQPVAMHYGCILGYLDRAGDLQLVGELAAPSVYVTADGTIRAG